MNTVVSAETRWKSLYRIGSAAIALTLAFYVLQLVVIAAAGRPFPTATEEWFSLFLESRFLGLFYLNALDMLSVTLQGVMFLALYMALRRDHESWALVGLFLAGIGVPVFVTPRAATLAILPLSQQYGAATTAVQREQLLAVGDAISALGQPTPHTVGFLMLAVAALIMAVIMLHSSAFGRAAAYTGMAAGGLTIIGFLSMIALPSIAETLIFVVMLPWLVWWVLIARRLYQLSR
jgi:hypothetical protein